MSFKRRGLDMIRKFIDKIRSKITNNRVILRLCYSKMDRSQAFNYIYSHKKWGEDKIKCKKYYSGKGSYEEQYVLPYIAVIREMIKDRGIKSIVDLGCGDFNVGKAIMEDTVNIKYGYCR